MGFMDWVHGTLDVAGMVPLFGEAADLTNAGLYAIQGDAFNAGISLAGCWPAGGQAATGGRLIYKGGKKIGKEVLGEGLEHGAAKVGDDVLEAASKNDGFKTTKSADGGGGGGGGGKGGDGKGDGKGGGKGKPKPGEVIDPKDKPEPFKSDETHASERHDYTGDNEFDRRSKFDSITDIDEAIAASKNHPAVVGNNGNQVTTFDSGRQVGFDAVKNQSTSTVTVVTKPSGEVITVHPGMPRLSNMPIPKVP